MSIYTKGFWMDAGERALWTFAQSLGAILTVDVVAGAGFFEVNWASALSVSLLATVYALIKALGLGAASPESGASLGTSVPKGSVAAIEDEYEGQYKADEAAPYAEGTPVDVIPEQGFDRDHTSHH